VAARLRAIVGRTDATVSEQCRLLCFTIRFA
jgi:hypothetical protein